MNQNEIIKKSTSWNEEVKKERISLEILQVLSCIYWQSARSLQVVCIFTYESRETYSQSFAN